MGYEITSGFISIDEASTASEAISLFVDDMRSASGSDYSPRGYTTRTLAPAATLDQIDRMHEAMADALSTTVVAPACTSISTRTVTSKITPGVTLYELRIRTTPPVDVPLKRDEQITGWTIRDVSRYTTKAVAAKFPTQTRYFVIDGWARLPQWEEGHPTQAAARAAAVEHTTRTGDATDVISITRRVDGSPLVSASRQTTKPSFEVTTTITKVDTANIRGWYVSMPFHS